MKKSIILFLLAFTGLYAFPQQEERTDEKVSRELAKQQRIEQRRMQEEATANMVDSLIAKRRFVLEAQYLSGKSGNRVIVNSMINFIVVDSSKITIQIASNSGGGGANGMGGVTTTGNITQFDVKKVGKGKGYYTIKLMAMTSIGVYDIFLNITPSNNADANITGITPGRLNYHGEIVPLEKSRVFKGMSI